MRRFFLVLPIAFFLFLGIGLLSVKNVNANHAGNYTLQCYLEAQDGNCENANVPTGCRLGDPNFKDTGAGCCLDYQESYSSSGHPGITATCANACIQGTNVVPRNSNNTCTEPDIGNSAFCCQYALPTATPIPPTPTPGPCPAGGCPTPTPTPVPPTPTPTPCPAGGCAPTATPVPPTPTPIRCLLSDSDGKGYVETCTDRTGTYKDFCSGTQPKSYLCENNLCTLGNQGADCADSSQTCQVQPNGKPQCIEVPTATPTTAPTAGPTPTTAPTATPTQNL